MPDDRSSDLLGQLPRTRPHRRSKKRPERAPGVSASNGASEVDTSTVAAADADPAAARSKTPDDGLAAPRSQRQRPTGPTAQPAAASRTRPPAPRTTRAATARAERLPQPAQPRGVPPPSRARQRPVETTQQPSGTPILVTAAQATVELAEIGLSMGTRALRRAIDRLPRP
jgi:hypothetical protein